MLILLQLFVLYFAWHYCMPSILKLFSWICFGYFFYYLGLFNRGVYTKFLSDTLLACNMCDHFGITIHDLIQHKRNGTLEGLVHRYIAELDDPNGESDDESPDDESDDESPDDESPDDESDDESPDDESPDDESDGDD
jgi:hypothetical protein